MRVAVLNAGSTGVKAALVDVDADGAAVRRRTSRAVDPGQGAGAAFDAALAAFGAEAGEVDAVGHRVVHGGTRFRTPVRIDASVEAALDALGPLAPLHNPPALEGVRAAHRHLPDRPMVAVFDTAFHAGRPPESLRPALPWALCDELGLYRYGFHGIAHASLVEALADAQGTRLDDTHAVTLQLGGGCSGCAVEGGRSVETSMGSSPLGGLPMATRSGDLDPGVVLELLRRGRDAAELTRLLGERSGWLGMAGSADLREVLRAEASGDERSRVAVALFVRRVVSLVGAYWTLLGGRGALVFGGGIGTHAAEIRRRVVEGLSAWNLELDAAANAAGAPRRITTPSSRPAWVFETDEETPIARDVWRVLAAAGGARRGR